MTAWGPRHCLLHAVLAAALESRHLPSHLPHCPAELCTLHPHCRLLLPHVQQRQAEGQRLPEHVHQAEQVGRSLRSAAAPITKPVHRLHLLSLPLPGVGAQARLVPTAVDHLLV